jgi:hypothetical protein
MELKDGLDLFSFRSWIRESFGPTFQDCFHSSEFFLLEKEGRSLDRKPPTFLYLIHEIQVLDP